MPTQEVYLCTEEALRREEKWLNDPYMCDHRFIPTTKESFPASLVKALFGARSNKTAWWCHSSNCPLDIWSDKRFEAVCDQFEVDMEEEAFDPGAFLPKSSSQAYVFLVTLEGSELSFSRLIA